MYFGVKSWTLFVIYSFCIKVFVNLTMFAPMKNENKFVNIFRTNVHLIKLMVIVTDSNCLVMSSTL